MWVEEAEMEVESMRPCEMKVQVSGELDSLMSM